MIDENKKGNHADRFRELSRVVIFKDILLTNTMHVISILGLQG